MKFKDQSFILKFINVFRKKSLDDIIGAICDICNKRTKHYSIDKNGKIICNKCNGGVSHE